MNKPRGPRGTVLAGVMALAAIAAAQGPPPAMAAATGKPAAGTRVIVRAGNHQLACAMAQAMQMGAKVVSRQAGLGTFVITMPSSKLSALRTAPCIAAVTPDSSVRLSSSSWSEGSAPGDLARQADLIGADTFWQAGYTGEGVGVALLDSGVAPVKGLTTPGKIVNGPDLSFESQSDDTRYLDTFGHGTHMAGIIAGKDEEATAPYTDPTTFTGVAPDAHLVSIKLADAKGQTDVSQVIAAIDWVVQHRNDPGLNIRVLNLSFGTDTTQNFRLDPLSYAAEQAWNKGIVVVVAAGNSGAGTGLTNPAYNPKLLAVGAVDDKGTDDNADDEVPAFSSTSKTDSKDVRNPDLVAPGSSIVSLRVPGSAADVSSSTARSGTRFFRGSGTSQSAAFASGAAALLISQRPSLTPDQVKALLTGSTKPLNTGPTPAGAGSGKLDLEKAFAARTPSASQRRTLSTGLGSLNASRGTRLVSLNGVALTGEKDIFGRTFRPRDLAARRLADSAWSGGGFNGSTWAGSTWTGSTWAGSSWAGSTWTGSTWAGSTWAGSTWTGATWTGSTWAGSTWAGSTWAGSTWANAAWSNAGWY